MLIFLTRPISHDVDCLYMAPPPPLRHTLHPRGLSLGTLNIHDGRGSGIAQAIMAVQIGVFDLMILMETKITNQAYCHNSLVYDVV